VGIYVYAIGRESDGTPPSGEGILGRPVYRLASGGLAAIVSDCPLETVRPERKHIAASQRVLSSFGRPVDLLPVAFGTVAQSDAALLGFLEEHAEVLTAQLHRIAGAVEMSLRLSLDVPDPIAHVVERTPELRGARDRLFARHRPPSYDERIRLGQLFDDALRHYREAQTAQTLALLEPSCRQIRTLPVGPETEIANLAMLVAHEAVDRFEGAVNDAAAQLPDELALAIGGPWPPHNFVNLEL
jgi:Gas vesicle synthesis protein GvpL/GvpF